MSRTNRPVPTRSAASPDRGEASAATRAAGRGRSSGDANEARYHAFVEEASEAMWVVAADGHFLDVNARSCELLGYTRDELLRLTVQDVIEPADLAAKPLAFDEIRAGGTVTNERLLRRRDGTQFLAETTSRGLPEGGAFGIVRDVTEKRQAEQALRASEERLRRVVESDLFGVTFAERSGRVSYANDYTLRMLGLTREDVASGRVLWDEITLPGDTELDLSLAQELATTGAIRPIERELRHADGRVIPALVGAALLKPAHDVIVGFLLDLSELKGVERRLAESQRLLERAQALAQVGFGSMDVASRVSMVSPELVRIFGLPPGTREVGGDELLNLVHPEDRERIARTLSQLGGQDMARYEHRVLRPDGAVRAVEVISETVRDSAGRPTHLLSSVQDITERRRLEEQLREAQKLEAIGRLAGGVAHDFNNLLTVILGGAEMLEKDLEAGDARRANLDEILGAARRAAGLTQKLLAFSRRQVLQPRVFDLHTALGELRPIIQRLVGPTVRLTVEMDARRSMVRADPLQIEQVILNLVVNARDAMPDGGSLAITTGDSADVPASSLVMLTVADDGQGMSADVQEHIFEPFYTTKEIGRGTGLGLAMVYGIVHQSGGRITVNSAPRRGTSFRIELPYADGPADPAAAAPDAAPSRGRETVLLVEDERTVRTLLATGLRARGYHVIEAAHPEEALRLARGAAIDLLVTDIVMPGMLGPDLARRLQSDRSGMSVLFVSGYSASGDPSGPDFSGAAFLPKPFGADQLARKVREVLDARAAAGGAGPANS